jgi:radical SAM superfamily enzyme YgiQ (UPF0313 family)
LANVVLISTYEMGRQPFGLASPAAWLREAGASVTMQDLAVSHFEPESVRHADMIGIYVPMHTATRLAQTLLRRVRSLNGGAHICVYGLYAPMNESALRELGADSIVGGEFEQSLVDLFHRVIDAGAGNGERPALPTISLERRLFKVPDRTGLPSLDAYAQLDMGNGKRRVTGYTEATRGCKHSCRHCPVVPVYQGRFVVVQPEVVLEDIRRQVAAGAEHVTFGDPDFFNGPAHAMRVVRRLHDEFPQLTYDATIKVEHLVRHADLLPELERTGCVLVTSAIESFDDTILERFDKRHSREDVEQAVDSLRSAGLALSATFVPFTPWTTLGGYARFLGTVGELELIDNIAPIQYAIRLLIPAGSLLLGLPDVEVGPFDESALSHPWVHPDPRVDDLQRRVLDAVERGQASGRSRRELFRDVWHLTHEAAEMPQRPPGGGAPVPATIPFLTEPWFC